MLILVLLFLVLLILFLIVLLLLISLLLARRNVCSLSGGCLLAPPHFADLRMGIPTRRIHQQVSDLGAIYRLADAVSVAGGLSLAIWILGRAQVDYLLPSAAAIIVHYLVAELGGVYRSWRGVSRNREVFAVLAAWLVAFGLLATLGFATGRLAEFSRAMLG